MAFQNNSGDIILDVVLTDEGRRRLALGDGTFEITQFALGDDEINYALFETGSTTALQDLSILQTPILEAFTNNTSMMKSKLLSLTQADLLYLPVLRLNSLTQRLTAQGNFVVCVDEITWDGGTSNTKAIGVDATGPLDGMIYGLDTNGDGTHIVIDSGIDSSDVTQITDSTPVETQFMIEMDNRLGKLSSKSGTIVREPSMVDDDNVATYIITESDDISNAFITAVNQVDFTDNSTPLNGPISKRLEFKIRSSADVQVSNFLFERIGSTDTTTYSGHTNVKIIDSIVRVSGMTTGFSIDIPVRFAKSV
jgi:hypothetical protein